MPLERIAMPPNYIEIAAMDLKVGHQVVMRNNHTGKERAMPVVEVVHGDDEVEVFIRTNPEARSGPRSFVAENFKTVKIRGNEPPRVDMDFA
jgi:hypothetical protein